MTSLFRVLRIVFALGVGGPIVLIPILNLVIVSLGRSPRLDPAFVMWSPETDIGIFRDEGPYRMDDAAMWEPRVGAYLDGDVVNEQGCRGPVLGPKVEGRLRIAVIGDSQAFGMSLPDNETWPRRIEQLARIQGRDVEVINAAVTGHSVVQAEARFEEIVAPLRPDLVLIAFSGVNDVSVAPHGRTDRERIRLLHDPDLALQNAIRGLTIVRSAVKNLWPNRKPSWRSAKPRFRVDAEDITATLGRLAQRTAECGGAPVFVVPWRKADASTEGRFRIFDDALRTAADASQSRVIDVPALRKQALDAGLLVDDENAMDGPFLDSFHYSRKGHDIVAGSVAVVLGKLGLFGSLTVNVDKDRVNPAVR